MIRALREPAATGGDAEITSARLTTKAKVAARHGRFEARIKVPAGRGVWPAFWLVGEDIDAIGWPACGEIDVMEVVGSEPRTVHGTIHGPGHAGLGRGIARTLTAPHDLSRAFHDFAVDWTPECVTWLLDGRPYGTVRRDDVPVGTWVLDREVHVIVNLAIGGDWPGNHPDGLALPVTMLVEHVRIASPRLRAG